ncbi:MAG: ribonuclease R [Chitinophagia bacterium]|nr:ribonuclease R [Chitinophagia bacterium]
MGRKNNRKKRKEYKRELPLYKGVFEITRSGMGFVVVKDLEKDIIIRPNDFNRAFHGDFVRVEVTKGDLRIGRLQGRIIQVIERKQKEFVGQIEVNRDFAFFLPATDKPLPDFFVSLHDLNGAKDGQKVIARIVSWEEGDKRPKGEVLEVITADKEGDLAMKEILIQQGFSLQFPEEVVEETLRIPELIQQEELTRRRDMRETLTFTIDPEDAKDFDDAISFAKIGKGLWEVGVHIADVSHYIQQDSALDIEAYQRATSVYLPDRVVPMLPERISNELCSLRPHEDKLTYACVFQISENGEIKDRWIGRTVIHSNHRFTYEDVQSIIETGTGLYDKEILSLHQLAKNFREKRMKAGAINFSSQEVRFKLDEKGSPIGIVIKESKESHQLIEEFMLLANRTVAEKVSKVMVGGKPIPFPYRIHDQPDEEKLIPFVEFARKYGYHFETKTPEAIARSFNEMLVKVKGFPEQRVLEQMGIRTMAKAVYTTKNIGHYGLGFEHYCHFTSPIRRYPDVLVHRVLTAVLKGDPKPDKKLEQQCIHSSERERAAMESERAANKYKQVEYMKQFLGEEFQAVVSGVASFGFWAETIDHKCEGLVSCTSLLDYDDFVYHEDDYSLVGRRSHRAFRIGDSVKIKVIAANLTKRQLDYEWILDVQDAELTTKRKKK